MQGIISIQNSTTTLVLLYYYLLNTMYANYATTTLYGKGKGAISGRGGKKTHLICLTTEAKPGETQ